MLDRMGPDGKEPGHETGKKFEIGAVRFGALLGACALLRYAYADRIVTSYSVSQTVPYRCNPIFKPAFRGSPFALQDVTQCSNFRDLCWKRWSRHDIQRSSRWFRCQLAYPWSYCMSTLHHSKILILSPPWSTCSWWGHFSVTDVYWMGCGWLSHHLWSPEWPHRSCWAWFLPIWNPVYEKDILRARLEHFLTTFKNYLFIIYKADEVICGAPIRVSDPLCLFVSGLLHSCTWPDWWNLATVRIRWLYSDVVIWDQK